MKQTIIIPQEFIDYRNKQQAIYNARGRSDRQQLMDCDCELHEWNLIHTGQAEASKYVEIDYTQGNKAIDVKFIPKWFNIAPYKILWMIQQRHKVTHYEFCEWINRPRRPFEAGDEISYNILGQIDYDIVMDNIRMSRDLGYYFGARQQLEGTNGA